MSDRQRGGGEGGSSNGEVLGAPKWVVGVRANPSTHAPPTYA